MKLINNDKFQIFEKISTGEDLYPKLKRLADQILSDKKISSRTKKQEYPGRNLHEKVRYEILKRFGFFVTESSEHFAEYVPWFIKPKKEELAETAAPANAEEVAKTIEAPASK